jgi:hypothetical protein
MRLSRALFMLAMLPGLGLPIAQAMKTKPYQTVTAVFLKNCCPVPQCPPLCARPKLPDMGIPFSK